MAGPGPTSVLSSGEVLAGPAPPTRLNRPQDSSEMLADDSVRFNLVAGLVPQQRAPGQGGVQTSWEQPTTSFEWVTLSYDRCSLVRSTNFRMGIVLKLLGADSAINGYT